MVATASHLYRINADRQAQEYTGKPSVWTVLRKYTERVFTSPTKPNTTDTISGNSRNRTVREDLDRHR
ncbi:hypothetical protein [Streptomyces sp. DH41]|uniref:hypothetical protein n=1 Tax=Streptomyces sp. DH41 TaxID=3040125 RepID=UPI002440FF25|nr:hypothetical protein [Streptomyces sp. DH41]MDG9724263.1 hypothetical protein [Streptomyces sp. DH41]